MCTASRRVLRDHPKCPLCHSATFQSLRIWHDGPGHAAAWYLESVEVKEIKTGARYFFVGGCWLSEADGPEKLLKASSPPGERARRLTPYKVIFKTGAMRKAGTDANVSVEVHGTSGSTGPIRIPVRSPCAIWE